MLHCAVLIRKLKKRKETKKQKPKTQFSQGKGSTNKLEAEPKAGMNVNARTALGLMLIPRKLYRYVPRNVPQDQRPNLHGPKSNAKIKW